MNIDYNNLITRDNPNVLDIGAYDGTHSLKFANTYPKGQIFSFEADPDVCIIFKNNIDRYELPNNNITLIEKAISDTSGKLIFNRALDDDTKRTGSSGTVLRPTTHLQLHPHVKFKQIEVESITLDSWFNKQDLDYIDFAWTDVNGAEISLLRGGQTTLKHTKYLQLECISWSLWEDQPTKNELLSLIPNFEIIQEEGADMLLKNKELV
jgi:FkbM family methyltransferase